MSEDLSWASPCSSTSTSPRIATTGTSSRRVLEGRQHPLPTTPSRRVRDQDLRQRRVGPAGVVGEAGSGWSGVASSSCSTRHCPGRGPCGIWGCGRDYLGGTDRRTHRGRRDLDVDRVPSPRRRQRPACPRLHPPSCRRVAHRDPGDGRRDRGLGHRLGDRPGLRHLHVGRRRPGRVGRRALPGERHHPRPPAGPGPAAGGSTTPTPQAGDGGAASVRRCRRRPRSRRAAPRSTTRWPTSRRCSASVASSERPLRRPQPAVGAAQCGRRRAARPAADPDRGHRSRLLRRQRRRPGATSRRQADPGRVQVAAGARADRARAGPRRLRGSAGLHRWPRRCGCTRPASATTSWWPTRASTSRRCAA